MSDQLKVGDRSDAIGIIANTLNRLGFLDKTSDLFDQSLEEAIKAFQQERGLTATGLVNEITQRALDEARWRLGDRILLLGTQTLIRGDDVSTLQERLIQMGFNCGKVDGVYGVKTEAAVKEFQKSVVVTLVVVIFFYF